MTTIQTASFYNRLSRIGAAIVVVAGAAVVLGWAFNISVLKSVLPGLAMMKANTALCFIAAGLALFLLRENARSTRWFMLGRVLAGAVGLIGILTMCEYMFRWNLRIDQLFFTYDADAEPMIYPGRMSPAAAINFSLIGLSLLGLKRRSSFIMDRSHWLVVPVQMVAMMALLGYAYGATSLYKITLFGSMALHTAFLFWLLSFCIFIADDTRGFMKIMVSATTGGEVARKLIPAIPMIIFPVGLLRLAGEQSGLYDGRFGLALLTTTSIFILAFCVAHVTVLLYNSENQRKSAESEVILLNAYLELRVKERTHELTSTLAEVRQLSGMLPICSYCKKVRDDKDYWHNVEQYVSDRTAARFSHGVCPDCIPRARAEMGLKPLPK